MEKVNRMLGIGFWQDKAEAFIYDLETNYLEETKEFGNIFTGWEAFTALEKMKTRKVIAMEDRHFSLSSVTSPASRKEDKKTKVETNIPTGPTKKKRKTDPAPVEKS